MVASMLRTHGQNLTLYSSFPVQEEFIKKKKYMQVKQENQTILQQITIYKYSCKQQLKGPSTLTTKISNSRHF